MNTYISTVQLCEMSINLKQFDEGHHSSWVLTKAKEFRENWTSNSNKLSYTKSKNDTFENVTADVLLWRRLSECITFTRYHSTDLLLSIWVCLSKDEYGHASTLLIPINYGNPQQIAALMRKSLPILCFQTEEDVLASVLLTSVVLF